MKQIMEVGERRKEGSMEAEYKGRKEELKKGKEEGKKHGEQGRK